MDILTMWWEWSPTDLRNTIKSLPLLSSQQRRSALGQIKGFLPYRSKMDLLRFIGNQLGMKLESRTVWVHSEHYGTKVPGGDEYRFIPIRYGAYTVRVVSGDFGERYTAVAPWDATERQVVRYLARDISIDGEAEVEVYGPFPIRPGLIAEGVGDY